MKTWSKSHLSERIMLTGSINIDVDIPQENWRLIRVEISVILDSDSDFIIGLIVARILKRIDMPYSR